MLLLRIQSLRNAGLLSARSQSSPSSGTRSQEPYRFSVCHFSQQTFFFRLISHFFLRRRGFQKLKAAQLASRRFRFGFGRQFGHHITDLDRTQPLHRELNGPDLHILDALPSLPNLHTIVTPLMSEAVDAVVRGIRIRQRWTIIRSHNGLDGEVSFVTDCFLELSRALARRRSEFFSTSFSVRHSGCTR